MGSESHHSLGAFRCHLIRQGNISLFVVAAEHEDLVRILQLVCQHKAQRLDAAGTSVDEVPQE